METNTSPETCCEYLLYSIINALGGMIWSINHAASHGRSSGNVDAQLAELREKIGPAVDQAARFGVESPVRSGENGAANESYWTWFRGWDGWVNSLSDEEFKGLDKLIAAGHGDQIEVGMDVSGTVLQEA